MSLYAVQGVVLSGLYKLTQLWATWYFSLTNFTYATPFLIMVNCIHTADMFTCYQCVLEIEPDTAKTHHWRSSQSMISALQNYLGKNWKFHPVCRNFGGSLLYSNCCKIHAQLFKIILTRWWKSFLYSSRMIDDFWLLNLFSCSLLQPLH